jgi:hypothetical protein
MDHGINCQCTVVCSCNVSALFAGTPPNPAVQVNSGDKAAATQGHAYGILWGLAGSLNLCAMASCLLFCVDSFVQYIDRHG